MKLTLEQFDAIPLLDSESASTSFADMWGPAVEYAESNYDPSAIGPMTRYGTRAKGAYQVMDATGLEVAQKLGIPQEQYDPFNYDQNKLIGRTYLNQMYDKFGTPELAFTAYNYGPGNVEKAVKRAGSTDFAAVQQYLPKETRDYVPKIMQKAASQYARPQQQALEEIPLLESEQAPQNGDYSWLDEIPLLEDEAQPTEPQQPPQEMDWGEYARGIGGQMLQGFGFNLADEAGLIDPELEKRMQSEYPKASLAANIGGGVAPAIASYLATIGTGGAAAPSAVATTATTAANASKLYNLIKGTGRVAAGLGPKTAAATKLGRIGQGVGYGTLYGVLSGAGAGEGAGDRISKALMGGAMGGVTGGAVTSIADALLTSKAPLTKAEELLSKRLKNVPEDVLSGAESTLRLADQPVFLPEALGTEDFYRSSKTIANAADTKDVAQAAIKTRYEAQPQRAEIILDDIAPKVSPAEAGQKLKGASEAISEALIKNRSKAAQATYGPVYQATPNVTDELAAELLKSKNAKRAANKVRESREFMDRPDTDTEFLHAVKSNLENTAKETTNASIKRGIDKDASYIRSVLNETVPGLEEADIEYSKLSQNIDDITNDSLLGNLLNRQELNVGTFGKKLLDSKTDAAEISKLIKDLGKDGENLVLMAVRAELSDQVANRVGGKNTISIFDKQALKDRLVDVLGEKKASRVIKRIDEEVLISEGTRAYNVGSKTASNIEDEDANEKLVRFLSYYGRNPTRAVGDASQYLLGKAISPSRQTLQDEARIIFSKDDAAEAIANILSNKGTKRQNQQNIQRVLPLLTGTSRAVNKGVQEIPVIEIYNSYKEY